MSSAAVVIGALRVNTNLHCLIGRIRLGTSVVMDFALALLLELISCETVIEIVL